METIGQRLARLRKAKKISQAALATAAGLSGQGSIGNIERDVRGYGASIMAIANALGTTPEYLQTGKGSSERRSNVEDGPPVKGKVPLISWVQAGEWCEALTPVDAADTERWMDCPVKHSPSTFVLRVRGDSMTAPLGSSRTYPEGCFIFVDPELRNPVNGERVIACLIGSDGSDVTFKVFKDEDGRRWLQPLNPSHEPIREKFKIIGTVIGKWEDE